MAKLLKDIRFWIIIFFILRLIGITQPPLEVGHNWRQTTVTMVSRNFLEIDNNIFYPRIDIAGEKTGITGMEFPLLNYMIYLTAEIFGYQHWYGRLINLIISSFGIWFFYRLVKKHFSEQIALYAAIILIGSIWFQFARKIMPDTFSMSFIIAGIYYGSNYFDAKTAKDSYRNLAIYFFTILVGVLSKLPSAYILILFSVWIFDSKIEFKVKAIFVFTSFLALLPSAIWYFYWVPFLVEEYGFWHFFMGKSFKDGFTEIANNANLTLNRFYETALKFIGFAAFLFGLIYAVVKKEKKIILPFVLGFISFSLIIFKAGFTFYHHNYYIVPFVPIMALTAAYGLSKIKNLKIALFVLVAIVAENILNQQHDFRLKDRDLFLLEIEQDLDSFSNRSDLFIINGNYSPTSMYFCHRKGWVDFNENIKNHKHINKLVNKGLKYILIIKTNFGTEIELKDYKKVLEKDDYVVYEAQLI